MLREILILILKIFLIEIYIALQHLKYIKVPITSEFSFEVLKHGKIEKPGGADFCALSKKLVKVLNIIYTLLKND